VKSHRSTPLIAGIAFTLLLAACGSDSDDASPDYPTVDNSTSTAPAVITGDDVTTSTTAPVDDTSLPEPTSTTIPSATTAAPAVEGTITTGSVTSAAGTTVSWELSGDAGELCFNADITNADPAVAELLGDGVADCLRPDGGIDEMDDAMSVSVGVVDGERTFGYLWGRVAPEIIALTIEHSDGSQTIIDLFDGPGVAQVFAIVVDTTVGPGVTSIDAVSGTQIEDSEEIRVFLRAGPTYPVTPSTTLPTDQYPTVGG
jgi:hypothetical protein